MAVLIGNRGLLYYQTQIVTYKQDSSVSHLNAAELAACEKSYSDRKKKVFKNSTLSVSKTRLLIRNIPKKLTEKELKHYLKSAVEDWRKELQGTFGSAKARKELKLKNQQDNVDSKATKQLGKVFTSKDGQELGEDYYKHLLQREGLNELITFKQIKLMIEEDEKLRFQAGKKIAKAKQTALDRDISSKVEVDSLKQNALAIEEFSASTPRNKGYAFAEFRHHAHALGCLRTLNYQNIDGKKIIIEFAIEDAATLAKRKVRLENSVSTERK